MDDTVIRTEGLCKQYGILFWKKKTLSLNHLTISVPRGTIYGFLGPNGAGKTTTIKILMDLIRPTSGFVEVLGKPVWNVPVKKKVGFLPDTPSFSSLISAYEFLNICAKLFHMSRAERKQRIREVLEIVQMTSHAKEKLGSFSRGQLQRIGIAQAILNKPELLILDEPLLGLDPYGRQDLKRIIKEQSKQGTTVFFSSHILSDVQEICDHAAVLNRGRLLCSGKLTSFLRTSGLQVRLTDADDILKELMPEARSCQKKEDGVWDLNFEKTPALSARLDALIGKYGNRIEMTEQTESLEDFFFAKIEEDNRNRSGEGEGR